MPSKKVEMFTDQMAREVFLFIEPYASRNHKSTRDIKKGHERIVRFHIKQIGRKTRVYAG
jgi:hypothetical protein